MSAEQNAPEDVPLSQAEVGKILSAFSAADWRRALLIAHHRAGGIACMTGEDLMQSAMTKLLSGERKWPASTHPMAVLDKVMHSIASNERKRRKNSPIDDMVQVDPVESDEGGDTVIAVRSSTQLTAEDELAAKQQLTAIYASVAGDEELEMLVMAWSEGIRGEDACRELEWDSKKYDAARKRLTRRLEKLEPDRSGR
ncbi:hypothetical protein [Comamonas testosteroni]|uniref:hypothetical protein n=1 Tax=Comamonas testosteroni TaxID=285 RepID=UPI0026E9B795|nr:hypothetical protein [Comamonas testosteroni]